MTFTYIYRVKALDKTCARGNYLLKVPLDWNRM